MKSSGRQKLQNSPLAGRPAKAKNTDVTARSDNSGRAGKKAQEADNAPRRASSLRKLEPKMQLPAPAQLGRLSTEDVELLNKLVEEPMECIYHETFPRVNSEAKLTGVLDTIDENPAIELGGDPDTPAASSIKNLTAQEERDLFMCFNYCRYRVMRVARRVGTQRLTLAQAREMIRWTREADKARTFILQANLSLVPAMAKRSKMNLQELGDLICEGNLALLRSVDKFDCSRGFKFSTYACRAILSSFSSSSAKSARYRVHFPTEFDPALEKSDELERRREIEENETVDELRGVLNENRAGLSDVEKQVLTARFDLDRPLNLDGPPRSKTLKQVAELIGVTKERVRQIQNKALDKLRLALDDEEQFVAA